MDGLREFLSMGGYAFYVWSSYGIAALVLLANLVVPMRQRKQLVADLRRKVRREQRRT